MTNQERLQANNEEIAEIQQILSTKASGVGGGVEIIDNLNSTRTDAALSANQGRLVNERVTELSNATSQIAENLANADVGLQNQINTLSTTKADQTSIDNLQTQITENKQTANDGLVTLTNNVTAAVNAINTNIANADGILQQQIASNDTDIKNLQDNKADKRDVEVFAFTITSHDDGVISEGSYGYDFGYRYTTSIKMTAPETYSVEARPCLLSFEIWYNIGMDAKYFTSSMYFFEDASQINFNTSMTNQGGICVAQISLVPNAYAGYWCNLTSTSSLSDFNFNRIIVKRKYMD